MMEKQTIRVIVAGGRDFFDYNLLKSKLDVLFSEKTVIVVSGMAKGADSLGERYAHENKLLVSYFPALWNQHGTRAGFIRNEEMAKYADACVCFWDGESSGTKDMIQLAEQYNLKLRVINY
jgi:hypothetical protein